MEKNRHDKSKLTVLVGGECFDNKKTEEIVNYATSLIRELQGIYESGRAKKYDD